MNTDITDRTDPISVIKNRLVPVHKVKQAKDVGVELRLTQARRTFASLVAAAENPPLQHHAEFKITGLGALLTQVVDKFYLADEQSEQRSGFTLSFEYRGREKLKHVSESERVHTALRKSLYNYGLRFRSVAGATTYRLEVEPAVPAFVIVTTNTTNARAGVSIALQNVAMLGAMTYDIPVAALERNLVDSLVELISSGDNKFYALIAKAAAGRP